MGQGIFLTTPLVDADTLAAHLGERGLVLLDASWYLPSAGRDPEVEYRRQHIPGARRFDLDLMSDRASFLPHMLPPPSQFARVLASLGIDRETQVVVYDGSNQHLSAPRVWWMLRAFGHARVAVLDGGVLSWISGHRPIEAGPSVNYPHPAAVEPLAEASLVCSRTQLEQLVADGRVQVVDARSPERFRGEVDEPRPGVRRGRIAGSCNLPFTSLSDAETGRFLPAARLLALFRDAGLDLERPIVASCGSGVTACVIALAVEVIRTAEIALVGPPVTIYDGSWAEWGALGPV